MSAKVQPASVHHVMLKYGLILLAFALILFFYLVHTVSFYFGIAMSLTVFMIFFWLFLVDG